GEYSEKLRALLAKEELGAMELHEVHMLTYTLENALHKIQADLEQTAEVLEEVHIASETNKPEVVREKGQVFVETTSTLLNWQAAGAATISRSSIAAQYRDLSTDPGEV